MRLHHHQFVRRLAVVATVPLATILFIAGCPSGGPGPGLICLPLSEDVSVDTTLSAACYEVSSEINVYNGATLTIMPGVTLKFAQGTGLDIASDGRLDAQGTADNPIVLTGAEAVRGFWDGVRMYHTNSTANKLDHVTIEYGGGYWDGNLWLDGSTNSPTRVVITNTTLRQSASFGLRMNKDVIAEGFAGNTFTLNALGAIATDTDAVGYLDDASTYAGNDVDIVQVEGGAVENAQTWPGIDANYLAIGSISVDAALSINPGATLAFASGETMTVWDDGSLRAIGTEAQPVTFTGMEATRGYWGGLRFYHSNSTGNRLEHVVIENGGGYFDANLYLDGGSSDPVRLDIVNTTLTGSSTDGFLFNNNVIVGEFHDNTCTGNATGAGTVTANTACVLDDTSTYTGNDVDAVHITGGSVTSECTWSATDAEYRIGGGISVDADLTIAAGARLIFESGETMTVWDDGSLAAVGTAGEPIEFNGVQQTPGYWGGLRFYHSNAARNRLEYVTISNGGGSYDGNLYIDGSSSQPAQVAVESSTITQSASYGISVNRYGTINADVEAVNAFSGNADGDVFLQQ